MTLCTTADVEALLQGDIDPDNDPKVVALLEMATELIEAEVGRPVDDVTERTDRWTLGVGASKSPILLPRWPVSAVASVTEDGTTLTVDVDYLVDLEAGIVSRIYDANGWPYPWTAGKVIAVTYTPAVPRGLRTLCAQAVARAFKAGREYATKPAQLAGLRQLTIGRWSATAREDTGQTAAEALSLTDAERAAARAYRDRRP